MTTTLTPTQEKAVEAVIALRNLTKLHGFSTARSQAKVLHTLSDDDMAVVAVELDKYEKRTTPLRLQVRIA